MFKRNPDVHIDIMRFRLGGGTRYFSSGFLGTALSTDLQEANELYAFPFFVPTTFRATGIAINVTTAGAAGSKMRLGIYADNGKIYPGKLILDSGEVAVDSTGVKEISINKTLKNGLYWLARFGNGAPTLRMVADGSEFCTFFGLISSLTTYWGANYYYSITYDVLPDPFPSGASIGTAGQSKNSVVFLKKGNY